MGNYCSGVNRALVRQNSLSYNPRRKSPAHWYSDIRHGQFNSGRKYHYVHVRRIRRYQLRCQLFSAYIFIHFQRYFVPRITAHCPILRHNSTAPFCGSIPVDLPNTKREELTNGRLDLVLMYALGSGARQKTESAGKIALGLKEDMLKDEQMAAYKSVKYLMFHYWSNPKAYLLTKEPVLVNRDNVPSEYLIRMEKDAVKYLLLDYNPQRSADLENINILKTQRRGEIRYLPFVTTLESIVDE